MCGFVGVVGPDAGRRFREKVERATGLIERRGPDDSGIHADDGCVLGFRRLSIIDLEHGHQPMRGADGSAIVFNGEVYNYRELARGLDGLKTNSDTEVVLELMMRKGLAALPEFDGMFALAHWNPRTRTLTLARDRLGIKPLYHARLGDCFAFASDIRALLALGVPARPNFDALDAHVTFLWNPGPETAFDGITRLQPGTSLQLTDGAKLRVGRYWRMAPSVAAPAASVEDVRATVFADVERQLVSDVPVGVFLSGGVDSSFIACALPEGQVRRAYTMAFSKADLARDIIPDESRYARQIAKENGLELVEVPLEFSADHFLETVGALEEPVGDPAAVSTRVLCAAADEKVLLSGMGGDELWGGYPRMRALELSRRLPAATRPVARVLQRVLPHSGPLGRAARNFAKLSSGAGLNWGDRHVRYLSYVSPDERRTLYVECPPMSPHARLAALRPDGADDYDVSLRFDLEQFLPCHNLHYTDKASMWESKEVRVPLLGNRMLDMATRFPASAKRGKAPLKAAARGVVSDAILDRRKAGFGAPVQGWLAGPLKPLLDDMLSETSVRRRGWFRPDAVTRLLDDERAGRTHKYLLIYELLVIEAWARTFIDSAP